MPNFDGGHYFLTVLMPVITDTLEDQKAGRSRSHRHLLAGKLALIATGPQTAASPPHARPSPFAGNTINHLARFAIIDNPAYNGRLGGETLINLISGRDPLIAQPVDRLTTPFLLFAADIDAQGPGDGEAALRRYTDVLWAMLHEQPASLIEVFAHCVGFDRVTNAEQFHAYIKRCQIETTMPFNDYSPHGLDVSDSSSFPMGAVKSAAMAALYVVLFWVAMIAVNGVLRLFGARGGIADTVSGIVAWGATVLLIVVPLLLIGIYIFYRSILRRGAKPFPAVPGTDLPSILKSLFVQQRFTRFAIDAQGLDDAGLYARFGEFLAVTKPDMVAGPTQPPGVVRAP